MVGWSVDVVVEFGEGFFGDYGLFVGVVCFFFVIDKFRCKFVGYVFFDEGYFGVVFVIFDVDFLV